MATAQHQMVDIKLSGPRTPEHQQLMSTAPINGDEAQVPAGQKLRSWSSTKTEDPGKPYVRFYSVGPQTKHIQCPLCKQRTDTTCATPNNAFDSLNCMLSLFSCCFPIFALSCLYTTCFKNVYKSKRKFCTKCGGHLGCYMRPH